MIIAALIVISLVVVLVQIRQACVSGHALGHLEAGGGGGGELDPPGSVLTSLSKV